jgi:hypothetical protein
MTINDFEAEQWAEQQWGQAQLGDARRTTRAVRLGRALAAQPAESLPLQTGSWGQLKAAYRLLNEPDVTHQRLSQSHWQATRDGASAPAQGAMLFVQDTSELDFTSHRQTQGLGLIGNGLGRGFLLHSCLTLRPHCINAQVQGLAAQFVWTRHEVKKGSESRHQRRHRRTEFDLWAETLEAIGAAPPPESGTVWVSVGDRASDVFSYFRRATALGWHCLARVSQNRVIETAQGERARLMDWARRLPRRTAKTLSLRGRGGEPQREVKLAVGWGQLVLQPPQLGPERKSRPVRAWCIRCWEESATAERLEWILLTTLEVRDEASALERVGWYSSRWVIEEYHKCLKSGCRMEARQLESAQGLMALLGFLSLVAVRLLQLRSLARTAPETEAREVVAAPMVEIVAARVGLNEPMTVRQFWHGVARLGGFLGRKSDGEPGWQTLWRGWQRLQDMCWGSARRNEQI